MKIKGTLTNCITGKEKIIGIECEIIMQDGRRLFQLINGVTGHESFYIDPRIRMGFHETEYHKNMLTNMKKYGWLACAGTENLWDRLFIPPKEMRKVLPEK